jgi:NAD-dependent dihydropyrimidine dehydrogenase PreA subunit
VISGKSGLNTKKLILYAVLIPVWVAAGSFIGWKAHTWLSKANKNVYLTELLISKPEVKNDLNNIDVQTFLSSGKTMEILVEESKAIRATFKTGSTIIGAFLGLVIGLTLLNLLMVKKNEIYQPNRSDCFSCGRCMDYCPVDRKRNIKKRS